MNILSVQNLTKQFKQETVVNEISFSLESDRCYALIGPNGAGKTTVLRLLTGLLKKTKGRINFHDTRKDIRNLIGYLPQNPVFYEWMTGEEFLQYSAQLCGMDKLTAKAATKELLKTVGIDHAKDKIISTYSGGMKQRLGIAQAIIHQPKLLILDEPVSALDPIGRREILTLMEKLKTEMTILFSTHILNDAEEISDDLIIMNKGSIVETGTMENLREKYQLSKIELQFKDNNMEIIELISSLDFVTNLSIEHNKIHLFVTNIDLARTKLMELINTNRWQLNYFNISRTSIEEMFMKAVK